MLKVAATRAIKMLRAGKLSPESIKKLLGIWKRERFVKNIGEGAEHMVDLVLHPKYGLVVRKARHDLTTFESLSKAAKNRLWRRISALQKQGKLKTIVHTHKVTPEGIMFQEYIRGKNLIEALKPRTKKLVLNYLKSSNPQKRTKAFRIWDTLFQREYKLTPAQQQDINLLKKEFYDIFDYARAPNILVTPRGERKIIDISRAKEFLDSRRNPGQLSLPFSRPRWSQFIMRKQGLKLRDVKRMSQPKQRMEKFLGELELEPEFSPTRIADELAKALQLK